MYTKTIIIRPCSSRPGTAHSRTGDRMLHFLGRPLRHIAVPNYYSANPPPKKKRLAPPCDGSTRDVCAAAQHYNTTYRQPDCHQHYLLTERMTRDKVTTLDKLVAHGHVKLRNHEISLNERSTAYRKHAIAQNSVVVMRVTKTK